MALRWKIGGVLAVVGLLVLNLGGGAWMWEQVQRAMLPVEPPVGTVDVGPLPENPADRVALGKAAYEAQDYAKAWTILMPLAEAGEAQAQYLVGRMYEKGEGVKENDIAAVPWLEKAANQGDLYATYHIAWVLMNGDMRLRNQRKAADLYIAAAKGGIAKAQVGLGNAYKYGKGLQENLSRAEYWYREAATQNDALAMAKIGILYKEREDEEAFREWFRKAGKAGDVGAWAALWWLRDPEAQRRLGFSEVLCATWYEAFIRTLEYECECRNCTN